MDFFSPKRIKSEAKTILPLPHFLIESKICVSIDLVAISSKFRRKNTQKLRQNKRFRQLSYFRSIILSFWCQKQAKKYYISDVTEGNNNQQRGQNTCLGGGLEGPDFFITIWWCKDKTFIWSFHGFSSVSGYFYGVTDGNEWQGHTEATDGHGKSVGPNKGILKAKKICKNVWGEATDFEGGPSCCRG